jgi:FkbH-like protein
MGATLSGLYWLPEESGWGERLRDQTQQGTLDWSSLVKLASARLDFTATIKLDRALRQAACDAPPPELTSKPIRLAILGSSTVDHLLPGVRVGGLRRGLWIKTYVPDYGQYAQELSDASSGLHDFAPTAVLFALDGRHLVGEVNAACTSADADLVVDRAVERCVSLWKLAKSSLGCRVFHQMPLPVFPLLLGHNEHRLPGSKAALLARIVQRLRALADEHGVDLLSVDTLAAGQGLDEWHDATLWLKAKHEVRASAGPVYGDHVARLLAAQQGRSAKCLVLDLDNTLWGGVIGDDGLEGIVLGQGSSKGEAFVALQQYARDLAHRGVILAVCSKNDEANALLPFERHPEMILKRSDIACFVANWNDKATNLRAIAGSLNIGIDSLVFLDDNPFERNIVRRKLPEVAVPELPEDPALYVRCVADAGYFETAAITSEDIDRSAQYQAQIQREAMQASATDLEGYLHELNMELRWQRFDRIGRQRIVQLINKTNQFNLTTRRYSEEEIDRLLDNPAALTLQLRLIDRFGDNGIIGIVIGLPADDGKLYLDTWLMSCRVLGRKVEEATMNVVMQEASRLGAQIVVGEYRATAKNGMVREHYRKLGFLPEPSKSQGRDLWAGDVAGFIPFEIPIRLIGQQEGLSAGS